MEESTKTNIEINTNTIENTNTNTIENTNTNTIENTNTNTVTKLDTELATKSDSISLTTSDLLHNLYPIENHYNQEQKMNEESTIEDNSPEIPTELSMIMEILNMPARTEKDLFGMLIERDLLLRVDIEQKLAALISKLKGQYKTSKLTCLHKNRDNKQKFPGINLVRQIFRCNGYHLKPMVYSRGYCKHNGKKIVERNFKIVREQISENEIQSEMTGLGIQSI